MSADKSVVTPRVVRPDRKQLRLVTQDLESLLPEDHEARAVWDFLERCDLSRFYAGIKAVEGVAGRSPTDPMVLLGLWLYATIDGVGSAREIERRSESDDAYRWLRGGVPVNHHMLSNFRVGHMSAIDELLTQSIALLIGAGLVTLKQVAQDGTRIRASAGKSSFRSKRGLEKCLAEAKDQVERVRLEAENSEPWKRSREAAARRRAAEERIARVEKALELLPEVEAKRGKATKSEPRVSTTDPDARVMQMSDGGYRPAFNIQFATDVDSKAVVGVDVTNSPSDAHQMPPMLDQIEQRLGQKPTEYLVDKGYVDHDSIDKADAAGVVVYGPVSEGGRPRKDGKRPDPHAPKRNDSEAVARWRARMASEVGEHAYRKRCESAELTNAEVKGRQRLTQVTVRGLDKVKCIALWGAIAVNLTRIMSAGLI